MIKLCKYLSTMRNRADSRFVAGLNNIPDRFLCNADFILSRHFTLLHSRFVKPPDWIWELFKKIILATGRDQETVKWEKKEFIPKQNKHDLLVGTLSIGIPSYKNNNDNNNKKNKNKKIHAFFIHEDNSKRCSLRNLKKIVNKSDVLFAVNVILNFSNIQNFEILL